MKERSQRRINFEVINPKGTNWCLPEIAQEISDWIVPESRGKIANMLPQKPEELLRQMKKGLTLLAVWNDKVVGHITLWKYNASGWGEIGSLIVAPLFRGQKIGQELVKVFSISYSNPIQLLATTKTERARFVFLVNGFAEMRFNELKKMSELVLQECCPCYSPPDECPKRDDECKLLIRRE